METQFSRGRRLLFGCWLVVLSALACSPTLRQLLRVQTAASFDYTASTIPYPALPLNPWRPVDAQEWARAHPDDAMAQVEAVTESNSAQVGRPSEAMRRGFGVAIERFPNQAWLHAGSARHFFSYSSTPEATPAVQGASPRPAKMPPPAEMARALEVAAQGAKLEPQNAFFPLASATMHFQLGDVEAARRSLSQAARCPEFDEHVGDEMEARLSLRRSQGPTTVEGETAIVASTLFPQYAHYRQFARNIVAQARQREARGQHAEALGIYGDLMKVGDRIAKSNGTIITSLVGFAIEAHAWKREEESRAPKQPYAHPNSDEGRARIRAVAEKFAAYARAHGRDDLARAAMADLETGQVLRASISQSIGTFSDASLNRVMHLAQQCRIGSALLVQVAIGLFAVAILSLWLHRRGRFEVGGVAVASAALVPVAATVALCVMMWRAPLIDDGGELSQVITSGVAMCWGIALCALPLVALWCVAGAAWERRAARLEKLGALRTSGALKRARQALAWTTAGAALGWVVVAAMSLPLRAQAQAELDDAVQNGEMKRVRQKAGLD